MSPEARILPGPPRAEWFKADPQYPEPYSAEEQLAIYGGKHLNRTAFPPVDVGLGLYERGAYTPRPTLLGRKNPIMSSFLAYGDLRVAGARNDNGGASGAQSAIAARLNLDMDLALTATERIHAFARPLDRNGSFTRYQFGNGVQDKFVREFNFSLKTLFFEGDLTTIRKGLTGNDGAHDMPIAIGRVPLNTQNGIWIDAAFDGAAVGILTARSSPKLDVSNFDLTLFTGLRKVPTGAAPGDDHAKLFGAAGFFDAHEGYAEFGYGYLNADNRDLSYHNVTAAFTRRYAGRIANSVRVIGNFGQKAPVKTADGVLLLIENSFIRGNYTNINPLTFVPYLNLFAGFKSPQPVARAGDAGGVLRNTGLSFESDGMTGYPTLTATAKDSYGGALGLEYLFHLDRQIVVEGARVEGRKGQPSEYAFGARYQHPISNAWIVRLDAMKGWREGQKNVYGARVEVRRKF